MLDGGTTIVVVMPPRYKQDRTKKGSEPSGKATTLCAETSHAIPSNTLQRVTKAYVLYSRTNRGFVQWEGCRRPRGQVGL